MFTTYRTAGPSSPPRKPRHPFISADNRPSSPDGIFRVVLITSGSVASVKMPDIIGGLCGDNRISMQIVATPSSTHFYSQEAVDAAVRKTHGLSSCSDSGSNSHPNSKSMDDIEMDTSQVTGKQSDPGDVGVKVWKDVDEWSDWKKVGDPILHIELRRWADLVVVAPCSADFLAKIAGGLCDNLALSLLRALPPSTPTILCPAMNTQMYQHAFTAKHLKTVQEELGYMVLGPQGTGRLACGDDGPGKMTDWREIVETIQNFSSTYHLRLQSSYPTKPPISETTKAVFQQPRPKTPPTPNRSPKNLPPTSLFCVHGKQGIAKDSQIENIPGNGNGIGNESGEDTFAGKSKKQMEAWKLYSGREGGSGKLWEKKFWF